MPNIVFGGFLKMLKFCVIIRLGICIQTILCADSESIDQLVANYDDDKNAMISDVDQDTMQDTESTKLYEDFYEELDNEEVTENSMNIIYFGPVSDFLRIDTEALLHIISMTVKSKIPISRVILAWDLITDGKTAAFLQGREYLAFDYLLNVVPEEDLYYANFGDPSVLFYFANNMNKLYKRKYGVLVSAYRRYYGDSWIVNSTSINELGYLLCGFPTTDLINISPRILREINTEMFNKLKHCSPDQAKALYSIAVKDEAYGKPYTWTAHEIGRLGYLFTYIPEKDISSLHLQSMLGITKQVMMDIKQSKLASFSREQMIRMNPQTRRIYILRTQLRESLDVHEINSNGSNKKYIMYFTNIIILFLFTLINLY